MIAAVQESTVVKADLILLVTWIPEPSQHGPPPPRGPEDPWDPDTSSPLLAACEIAGAKGSLGKGWNLNLTFTSICLL